MRKGKAANKINKRNKKIAIDFKSLSHEIKDGFVRLYVQMRFHIFGIKFFRYWEATHQGFNPEDYIQGLKTKVFEIQSHLFSTVNSSGLEDEQTPKKNIRRTKFLVSPTKSGNKYSSTASQIQDFTHSLEQKGSPKSNRKSIKGSGTNVKPSKVYDLTDTAELKKMLEAISKTYKSKGNGNGIPKTLKPPKFDYVPSKLEIRKLILRMIQNQGTEV